MADDDNPREPQQLELPFEFVDCPRCGQPDFVEFVRDLHELYCRQCSYAWKAPVDEAR